MHVYAGGRDVAVPQQALQLVDILGLPVEPGGKGHETAKKKTPVSGINYIANFNIPEVHFV